MSDTKKKPVGHVYAQEMPSMSCHILGNREFIERVAAACNEALNGSPEKTGLNHAYDGTEIQGRYLVIAGIVEEEQLVGLPDPFTDPAYRRPTDLATPTILALPQIHKRLARYCSDIDKIRNSREAKE